MAKKKVLKKERKDAKFTSKSRLKTPYMLDGVRVPSVSTICGMIDKSRALMYWAWDLGRKGIDYRAHTDDLANVGKLVHDMILAYFLEMEVDTYQNSQWEIDRALNSMKSFYNFISRFELKPAVIDGKKAIEHELISREFLFGGRLDYYGDVDKIRTLMDFKTGKRMYEDQMFQCGGYSILLEEYNLPVDQFIICNIPRSKGESFEVAFLRNIAPPKRVFFGAHEIYNAIKESKKIMKESVETVKVKEPKAKKEDPKQIDLLTGEEGKDGAKIQKK